MLNFKTDKIMTTLKTEKMQRNDKNGIQIVKNLFYYGNRKKCALSKTFKNYSAKRFTDFFARSIITIKLQFVVLPTRGCIQRWVKSYSHQVPKQTVKINTHVKLSI